jgi:hypothetical protein
MPILRKYSLLVMAGWHRRGTMACCFQSQILHHTRHSTLGVSWTEDFVLALTVATGFSPDQDSIDFDSFSIFNATILEFICSDDVPTGPFYHPFRGFGVLMRESFCVLTQPCPGVGSRLRL